jgi:asparagine synthase (glutamine-hydrolysing)
VPDRILDGPKRGFEVPVGHWLEGPLLPAWRDEVTPAVLEDAAGIDVRAVARLWDEHAQQRTDRGRVLWALFVLCRWHRATRPAHAVAAALGEALNRPAAGRTAALS